MYDPGAESVAGAAAAASPEADTGADRRELPALMADGDVRGSAAGSLPPCRKNSACRLTHKHKVIA